MSERDKFFTEAMGGCWHEPERCYDFEYEWQDNWRCTKCGKGCDKNNLSFSTWSGFGKLWEWAQAQEWFWDCVMYCHNELKYETIPAWIHPDRFANAVYKFLKERSE